MSDETVIDLKTRKPWAQSRAEERKAKRRASRQAKKNVADAVMQHREDMLEVLEKLTRMVTEGRLEGLVIVSRETSTKLFLTELALDERIIAPNELHSLVGVMEALKLELADSAMACAPCLTLDGSVMDPQDQPEEDWETFE